jgi:hypothetical protein
LTLRRASEGNVEAAEEIARKYGTDPLDKGRAWYDNLERTYNESATRAGFPGTLPRVDDYIPRYLSDEMVRLARKGKHPTLGKMIASFMKKRELLPGTKFMGVEIPEGATPDQVREIVDRISMEELGAPLWEADINRIAEIYSTQVAHQVAKHEALAQLKQAGVLRDPYVVKPPRGPERPKVPVTYGADEYVERTFERTYGRGPRTVNVPERVRAPWLMTREEFDKWVNDLEGLDTKEGRDALAYLSGDGKPFADASPDDLWNQWQDWARRTGRTPPIVEGAAGTPLDEWVREYERLRTTLPKDSDKTKFVIGNKTEAAKEARRLVRERFGANLDMDPGLNEAFVRFEEVTGRRFQNDVLDVYDRALNWTKAWQTATPGFHTRNLFGGIFNNALAGINPKSYVEWRSANKAYSKGGDTWRAYKAANPQRAEWYVKSRQLAGEGQFQSEVIELGRSRNPLTTAGPIIRFNRDKAGANVEGFLRGSLAYDALKKGGTPEEAIGLVDQFHFNYDDLTRFEKNVVKRVIPFYVWTRRNLPLQLEMMVKRPSVYSKYNAARRNLSLGVPIEGVVPGYYEENFASVTPFSEGGSQVFWMPDLPFRDVQRVNSPEDFLSQVTPLLKTPVELFAGKQFFKGLPITGKEVEVPSTWAPILPAMAAVGWAKKKGGNWVMADNDAYVVEQFLPMLGRGRRLAPSEKKYQERQITQWVNFVTGIGARTNTPSEQKSERFRRKLESGELTPETVYVPEGGRPGVFAEKGPAGDRLRAQFEERRKRREKRRNR